MKHPFHTLFYIGFSVMSFVVSFIFLILINLSDIIPFSSQKEVTVVDTEVIEGGPMKLLNPNPPDLKPIQKILSKQTPKPEVVPNVSPLVENTTTLSKDTTIQKQEESKDTSISK